MELLLDNIQRYFDFCKERHSIYIKKSRGDSWPWIDDIILQTYKFTCVYRQLDKGTLWLTENIIKPYSAHPYLFFNVALYRRYNYWPMAQAILDEYKLLDNPRKIKELPFFVRAYKDKGNQVFTGAHMINCAKPCKDKIEYIFDAVDMCKKIADAHIEDVAKAFGAPPEHFKDLPNCPFEVRIMEKDCEENDDEKVSMYFPVTIGDDGKYEAKAEDLMNAAIDMFNGNLCVKWDGLLPKGWHSVEDSK